jgi:GTP-binding protein LepA
VFAGLYPVDANEYTALREALEKLHLNDASLRYEPESSQALGFGFRCGFLGPAAPRHRAGAARARVRHELITTAPTVVYQIAQRDGTVIEIENPSKAARPVEDRGDPRADHHGDHPRFPRITSGRC